MVEEFRKAPVENMDEVIYYVNGTYRLLEFLVSATIASSASYHGDAHNRDAAQHAPRTKGHITLDL